MRSVHAFRNSIIALLAIAGGACLLLSQLAFADVKALLDARSADGDVESYTAAFHARILVNLRVAAFASALLAFIAWRFRRPLDRALDGLRSGRRAFASDVVAAIDRLWKSTGSGERVSVGLLLLFGAALRFLLLDRAVIYDEAFTCTYYAVRPWYIILSDYSYPNNHILHTLLVKAGMALFGWGEVQARLPAFGAGIAALVLCWLWLRSIFGHHVAFFTLALCVVSAPLIEYSALARGYSITWVCMLASLLLAGHFLRTGNLFTALLLAVVNAIGLWSVPTMIYASAMVYAWILIRTIPMQGEVRAARIRMLFASGIAWVVFTLLLYAPVLVTYGPGQLFYDETMGPRSWTHVTGSIAHRMNELSSGLTHESHHDRAIALIASVLLAAILSRAYRQWIIALLLGIVPLVLLQQMIGPPRIWWFALFILLPAPAVLMHELFEQRWVRALAPRKVGVYLTYAAVILVMLTSDPRGLRSRVKRFPEAREAAMWLAGEVDPGDRVLVNVPCEAPLEFYFMEFRIGMGPLYHDPQPGSTLWFVVGTDYDHSFEALAERARLPRGSWSAPRPVWDLDRMAIFAARSQ